MFYPGSAEEGDAFFRGLWPEARAVSDPDKNFYNAFAVPRGGLREMFGAEVWSCAVRATAKGNFIGKKSGDPWTLPALYLADEERILWQHVGRHAGDHPDFTVIAAQVPRTMGSDAKRIANGD